VRLKINAFGDAHRQLDPQLLGQSFGPIRRPKTKKEREEVSGKDSPEEQV